MDFPRAIGVDVVQVLNLLAQEGRIANAGTNLSGMAVIEAIVTAPEGETLSNILQRVGPALSILPDANIVRADLP